MEKVVAFAAGALRAVGGGVSHAFLEFAKQQYIFVPEPARVQYFETGGISAQIGPDSVLCGTASFLMRMGIHVSEGRSIKSGVFVAVNGAFAGVFALKYSTPPQSYSAFRVLRVGRLRPLLATRDFNVRINLPSAPAAPIFPMWRSGWPWPRRRGGARENPWRCCHEIPC